VDLRFIVSMMTRRGSQSQPSVGSHELVVVKSRRRSDCALRGEGTGCLSADRTLVECAKKTVLQSLEIKSGDHVLAAFFRSSVGSFLDKHAGYIVGDLSSSLIKKFSGDHAQQLASWDAQLDVLRDALKSSFAAQASVAHWGILLEYPLLRLQRRLDVVLLCGQRVVVIEFKVGATKFQPADARQVEDYALDLRDFHKASRHLNIIPVLCATNAPNVPFSVNGAPGVAPLCRCNQSTLPHLFIELANGDNGPQIEVDHWDTSPYRPVPTIIEAAELLYAGHEVAEIAHASSLRECLKRVLCHEYRRSKRRCVTVREMKGGPSRSAIRG
jgi:hypothetical protein